MTVTPPAGSPSPGAPIRPEHGPEIVEEFRRRTGRSPATLSGHPDVADCGGSALEEPYQRVVNAESERLSRSSVRYGRGVG